MFRRSLALLAVVSLAACLLVLACTPGLNPEYEGTSDEVRAEPTSIDFGYVEVESSTLERFEVINATAGTVTLRSVTVSGDTDVFALVSPPEEDFALTTGQERTINVSFAPTSTSEFEGTVVVETDHADYPTLEVALVGCGDPDGCGGTDDDDTGGGDDDTSEADDDTGDDDTGDDDTGDECGTIDLDPSSIVFPATEIGQTVTEDVTISNTGSAELEITSINTSTIDFGYQGISTPTTIQPGGSLQFSAKFTPQSAGTISGTLTVSSCDGDEEVELQGEGEEGCGLSCQPDIEVTPMDIDFGTITGGSAVASFSLSNTGIDPLHLSSVTGTTSVAGGVVSIAAGDTTATIQPGGTEYYTVEWVGGELFPGNGCLDALSTTDDFVTIHSDDPDEATVLVALDGCCDAATGGTFCTYGDLVSLLMCMSTAPCSDPLTAILYCTLGLPC